MTRQRRTSGVAHSFDGASGAGLVAVWLAFGVTFIGGRAALLLRRARGDDWMVLGAGPGA